MVYSKICLLVIPSADLDPCLSWCWRPFLCHDLLPAASSWVLVGVLQDMFQLIKSCYEWSNGPFTRSLGLPDYTSCVALRVLGFHWLIPSFLFLACTSSSLLNRKVPTVATPSLQHGLFTHVVSSFLRLGSLSTEHGLDSDQSVDFGEGRGQGDGGKASHAAQTPRLNALFKAGWLVRVSVKHMHVLEEAADTGLTVQQVAVSYQDVTQYRVAILFICSMKKKQYKIEHARNTGSVKIFQDTFQQEQAK